MIRWTDASPAVSAFSDHRLLVYDFNPIGPLRQSTIHGFDGIFNRGMMSANKSDCTRLLVVDDDLGMHTLVQELVGREAITLFAATTLADGLRIAAQHRVDIVLLDHQLPDGQGVDRIADFIANDRLRPILYITAQAGSQTAIEAIQQGAFEYLSKPIDFKLLRQRINEAIEYRRLTRMPVLVDSTSSQSAESDLLVGRCRGMQEVYKSIGRFSNLRTPILIEGEVGTGKEMIARAIHQNGNFKSGPFRKIASKEFDDAELQIELFGSKPTSNTTPESDQIKTVPSALVACSGGTLMIDDIEHWSTAMQSRLLRFFQDNSLNGQTINTRVILATSLHVRDLVQSGKIRNDLFYLLSPFLIRVPALRDRQDDLDLLITHFMQRIANVSSTQQSQGPPRISSAALKLLRDYEWPGNVAELKSVLLGVLTESRGAILATDALMRLLDLGHLKVSGQVIPHPDVVPTVVSNPTVSSASRPMGGNVAKTPLSRSSWDLESFVGQQIAEGTNRLYEQAVSKLDEQLLGLVLEHTKGNRVQASKILGITRTSLRRKLSSGCQNDLDSYPLEETNQDDSGLHDENA